MRQIFCFHSLINILIFLSVLNSILCKSISRVPDYIVRCKKNDPHLDQCMLRAIESMRPRLDKGIPELGIPPVDPFVLPEVVVFNGEKDAIKAKASDVVVTGLKNFNVQFFSADLDKMEFKFSVFLPSVQFEGKYDVNAKFSNFKVKGKGPFSGNTSDITINGDVKAKLVTFRGDRYLEPTSTQIRISFKDYYVRLEKLFKDQQLTEAFNQVINDRSIVPMETVKSMLNDFASQMCFDTLKKMSKIISYDELFI